MNKKLVLGVLFVGLMAAIGIYYFRPASDQTTPMGVSPALAAKFNELSQNGNSNCSEDFTRSIENKTINGRIQGSCCSPMDFHHYGEQVEGLKRYSNIPEIPPDPYDLDAALATRLIGYYDLALTPAEQAAYDYAMENSHEKGPCCCMCWHWYVYGGLGKYLIHQYGFTGEQITDIWDLSDGCGGAGSHAHDSGEHMMQ